MTNTPDTRFITYARKAAEGFLRSWEHYGQTFVQVAAIGGPATPAYYSNMLAKAVHMLDDHAALSAASDAAKARDGHAFAVWEFYAQSILDRRIGQPVVQVWGPNDFAETLAAARQHQTYAGRPDAGRQPPAGTITREEPDMLNLPPLTAKNHAEAVAQLRDRRARLLAYALEMLDRAELFVDTASEVADELIATARAAFEAAEKLAPKAAA